MSSFSDRIKAQADATFARERAEQDAKERQRRELELVRQGYDNALRELVRTCAEVAREANQALPADRQIDVKEEGTEVLLSHRGYNYALRHHLRHFFDGQPYAQGIVSRRRGWSNRDVEQLDKPTFPLVVGRDEALVWRLDGRTRTAREVAESVVESLIRRAS